MDVNSVLIPALIIGAIGLVCGLIIYFINARIKDRNKNTDMIDKATRALPGRDCGACGYASCYSYAKSLADNPDAADAVVCPSVLESADSKTEFELALGIRLNAQAKKAFVLCTGKSEDLFDYSGVMSCKTAAGLLGGFKKCPFACLGLGDCASICRAGAISLDENLGIAVINRDKCSGCGVCVAACPRGLIELTASGKDPETLCGYGQENIWGRERCERAMGTTPRS